MKSEEQKKLEIMQYFEDKIFNPALLFGKQHKNTAIIKGVNLTKMRMSKLSSKQMIHYFWSAICGTDKSIKFSKLLKDNNILRFEDIFEDVRVRFNDDYFNG